MNGKAMRKRQVIPGQQIWFDLFPVYLGCQFIWHQHHDNVAIECRFSSVLHDEPGGFGFCSRGAITSETNNHVAAGFLQVVGMREPLGAISDYRYSLSFQVVSIGVLIVINLHESSV